MMANPDYGLPYGSVPRILLAWMTTEAVRTKSPLLELGSSLTSFLNELGMSATGGRWGSIGRVRDQLERLTTTAISCTAKTGHNTAVQNAFLVSKADLWWTPKSPEQVPLWKSTIELGNDFFQEAIENPVPIDMRALKLLMRSPLALDIYCWLTYRMSYLRKPTCIPWQGLKMQFGAGYPDTTRGLLDFKKKFLEQLKTVQAIYPSAKAENNKNGLLLKPSPTHIRKIAKLIT